MGDVQRDGNAIVYESFGSGEPALVLVHGWTNNRTFWRPHVEALARSHRVVTLDLAGFGDSGASRSDWTMELFGEDVAAVVRALPESDIVAVGFSMGGAAVLEAARLAPDQVAGVVLVDILQDPTAKYSEAVIDDWVSESRASWHDPEVVRAKSFSPATPDFLIERYIEATPASRPAHWWPAIIDFFHWADARLPAALADVQVPILAINKARTPTNVEAWRELVPSFEVAIMADVGHLGVIWERTDEFDQHLLDFVARLTR